MIPRLSGTRPMVLGLRLVVAAAGRVAAASGAAATVAIAVPASGADSGAVQASLAAVASAAVTPIACLSTGDGYLHAKVAGAIETRIDWPNSGTRCLGEAKSEPAGVRLSFQRVAGGQPDLLFVFGLTAVRAGEPKRAVPANLTIIVQGTDRIYGTLGDARCTVDSLTQKPLSVAGTYRLEARGFCTQPAHAVRGTGEILVSTFEFAGPVNFDTTEALQTDPR